jgi:hypothetical protein
MFNIVGKSLGRYHVMEQLGEGGMAAVFKAYDSSLERYVAIKVIRTEIVMDQEFLKRFQREARALAQLNHPYILKVLDYGEQDGMPYLVMPFAPGGTLKERMGSPWPYQEAARMLAPIATKTVTAGPTETLPPLVSIESLPADVAVLPQNYGDLITSTNDNMNSYIFTTWLPFNQTAEYYRKAMLDQGWTIMNTATTQTPPSKVFNFTKDNNQRMVNVQIVTPKAGNHTMIMLMLITPQ